MHYFKEVRKITVLNLTVLTGNWLIFTYLILPSSVYKRISLVYTRVKNPRVSVNFERLIF